MRKPGPRRSHAEWSRTRLRGRRRFILTRSVLLDGGLMTLGFGLGQYLGGWFSPIVFLFEGMAFLLGGYCLGLARWWHNESVYRTGQAEEIG